MLQRAFFAFIETISFKDLANEGNTLGFDSLSCTFGISLDSEFSIHFPCERSADEEFNIFAISWCVRFTRSLSPSLPAC